MKEYKNITREQFEEMNALMANQRFANDFSCGRVLIERNCNDCILNLRQCIHTILSYWKVISRRWKELNALNTDNVMLNIIMWGK